MSDIIIAAAAAKTVKLKSKGKKYLSARRSETLLTFLEEVPPPTIHDEAERLVRRLISLTQKGEWDMAIENLKVESPPGL